MEGGVRGDQPTNHLGNHDVLHGFMVGRVKENSPLKANMLKILKR